MFGVKRRPDALATASAGSEHRTRALRDAALAVGDALR